MILLKLIIIKVKLQLIFNPAEQSILTVRINLNTIVVLYRGKRNPINPSPKVFTLLIIPYRYNLSSILQ
jgi:hypothetical protein